MLKDTNFLLFFGLSIALFGLVPACIQAPDYPIIPVIEFVAVDKSIFIQNTDSLLITLSFTDGDGDLGFPASDPNQGDILITDNRTGYQSEGRIPEILPNGVGNGISGEIYFTIPSDCCIETLPPCSPSENNETISYSFQIKDRAGNLSNTVQTPELSIICQ